MDDLLQDEAGTLRLSGPQRLTEAVATGLALREALTAGDVAVDLTAVPQIDAAFAQMLVSGGASARRLSRRLQVTVADESQPATLIEQLCLGDVLDLTLLPASAPASAEDLKETL